LFVPPPEKLRSKRPGQALVFSEKDLPGYKPRTFAWDDIGEDGNPGQGRSFLYERHKREQKKKENKGRFVPYARRPIPKQTAVAGTIAREFVAVPVKNNEYFVLENKQAAEMLKVPEREQAIFAVGADDPARRHQPIMTTSERANANKVRQPELNYMFNMANFFFRPPRLDDMHKRKTATFVSRNMSSSTNSWNYFASTEYGVSVTSRVKLTNLILTYAKPLMRSHLCGRQVISTASGS